MQPQPITKGLLKQEWSWSKKRREAVKQRRDVYQHDWREQLHDEVLRQFLPQNANKLLSRADTSMNVLRWAVDEIAAIYSRPVTRLVGDLLMAPMPEVDLALDLASKLTFYQGEALIRPFWSGDRLLMDVVPADRFTALFDPVDRLKLRAVIISHLNSRGDATGYDVWTPEWHLTFDRAWHITNQDPADQINLYGVVPYFCAHAAYPTASAWHWHDAQGLHDATVQLGVALTDWGHLRHTQSFKQLWIKSEGSDRSKIARLATDPTTVLTLSGPNASAGVLDMQANLVEMLDAILTKVESILHLYGIRPEVTRGTAEAQSGYALKLKLYGLEDKWEKQRLLWRLWERELWKLARLLLPFEGGPAIPEGPLSIIWPELGPGRDPQEVSTRVVSEYSAGLLSRAEALRQLGHSDEKIAQIQLERMEEAAAEPVAPALTLPMGGEGGI